MAQREQRDNAADPALWRGLTSPRVSRRSVLRVGGLAASAAAVAGGAGLTGLLAGCGNGTPAAAVTDGVGKRRGGASSGCITPLTSVTGRCISTCCMASTRRWNTSPRLPASPSTTPSRSAANATFYKTIKPSLERRQNTGYDIIVMATNSPVLGEMITNSWLTPLDQSMMSNFRTYASRLAENPPWDPGNTYTMTWQSGWTAVGFDAKVVTNPGTSVGILFDKKYAGRVGMLADTQELGSVGLLAIGVEPATSTESDWRKAAAFLQKQKDDGIVRGYYDQSYIDKLKSGAIVVTQAYSGDIFQADLEQQYQSLQLLMPVEGAMFWTDNMCIPVNAQNPKDAMVLMDYFFQPDVEAVVEYYNDYVCPVPQARQELLHPTGWAATALAAMRPEIGRPPSYTAESPLVFPTPLYQARSRSYYQFSNAAELAVWNGLFQPIASG